MKYLYIIVAIAAGLFFYNEQFSSKTTISEEEQTAVQKIDSNLSEVNKATEKATDSIVDSVESTVNSVETQAVEKASENIDSNKAVAKEVDTSSPSDSSNVVKDVTETTQSSDVVDNRSAINPPSLLSANLANDIVYGSKDAPVTIVEYASLSCSHCAKFYEDVVSKMKEKYLDSGKVKLVFRHYPLNAPALKSALLVDCIDSDDAKKKKLVSSLFDTQSQWAFTSSFSSGMQSIANDSGIGIKEFNDCISDKEKEDIILAQQLKAHRELKVNSTPAVFINGKHFKGNKDLEGISEVLDKLLK